MGLTVATRELTSAAEAWAIGAAWDTLLTGSVSNVFFLTRMFQSIWWDELGEGQLHVVVGESAGDRPRFIAPLYISQAPGLGRTVRQIGGSHVADYLDIIAAPDELEWAWEATLDSLARAAGAWDVIDLRAVPARSETRRVVAEVAARRGWSVAESLDEVCPIIALPDSWEGYLRLLRKKDRHELRRKIGRLERAECGERFEVIGPDDDLEAAIEDFFRLHRLSGQEKDGFWTESLRRFFRRLIVAAHAEGTLRLVFQSVAGQRAAVVLSFRYGDRYYAYNSGYDPAYREYAVGVVGMGRAIQAAIADGAAIFDLLQGDESYKYDFGAVNTEVYRIQVRPSAG